MHISSYPYCNGFFRILKKISVTGIEILELYLTGLDHLLYLILGKTPGKIDI